MSTLLLNLAKPTPHTIKFPASQWSVSKMTLHYSDRSLLHGLRVVNWFGYFSLIPLKTWPQKCMWVYNGPFLFSIFYRSNSTQQNACCISKSILKHQQNPIWKSNLFWFRFLFRIHVYYMQISSQLWSLLGVIYLVKCEDVVQSIGWVFGFHFSPNHLPMQWRKEWANNTCILYKFCGRFISNHSVESDLRSLNPMLVSSQLEITNFILYIVTRYYARWSSVVLIHDNSLPPSQGLKGWIPYQFLKDVL